MEYTSENENGYHSYNDDENISTFEDVQEEQLQYYSWLGNFDQHDNAQMDGKMSPTFDTGHESVEWVRENCIS